MSRQQSNGAAVSPRNQPFAAEPEKKYMGTRLVQSAHSLQDLLVT